MIDLQRLPEWTEAVDAYRRGDSRKMATFIRQNGVEKGAEAETLAELLSTPPDARLRTKKQTQVMLDELATRMRYQKTMREVVRVANERRQKLAERLARLGWSEAQIEPALRRRYAWTKTAIQSDEDIVSAVAERHGIDAESLKKSRLRQNAKNVKDTK